MHLYVLCSNTDSDKEKSIDDVAEKHTKLTNEHLVEGAIVPDLLLEKALLL